MVLRNLLDEKVFFLRNLLDEKLCNQSFVWRFYVFTLLFGLFCGCRGFCHRTKSDLFPFLFLQVAIVVTCFQSEKSQNKLYVMQSFLLKRFTKPVKINVRGSKATKSHLSNLTFLFCLNLYQSTILHLVKTFRVKTLKKSIKNCPESM